MNLSVTKKKLNNIIGDMSIWIKKIFLKSKTEPLANMIKELEVLIEQTQVHHDARSHGR